MKNLLRPPVDMELIQEHFESYGAALTRRLEIAATHASALSTVVSTARTLAGSVAVVQPQSDELCRALRIGVRAAAALFAVATGNGMVEVDLGEMRTKLPATGPTDATHAGHWRVGWWFSHILRDRQTIESLTATPVDVLRHSSTRGDECQYLFVEALQAFEKRSADFSAKLRAAIDATDPEKIALVDEEF